MPAIRFFFLPISLNLPFIKFIPLLHLQCVKNLLVFLCMYHCQTVEDCWAPSLLDGLHYFNLSVISCKLLHPTQPNHFLLHFVLFWTPSNWSISLRQWIPQNWIIPGAVISERHSGGILPFWFMTRRLSSHPIGHYNSVSDKILCTHKLDIWNWGILLWIGLS